MMSDKLREKNEIKKMRNKNVYSVKKTVQELQKDNTFKRK